MVQLRWDPEQGVDDRVHAAMSIRAVAAECTQGLKKLILDFNDLMRLNTNTSKQSKMGTNEEALAKEEAPAGEFSSSRPLMADVAEQRGMQQRWANLAEQMHAEYENLRTQLHDTMALVCWEECKREQLEVALRHAEAKLQVVAQEREELRGLLQRVPQEQAAVTTALQELTRMFTSNEASAQWTAQCPDVAVQLVGSPCILAEQASSCEGAESCYSWSEAALSSIIRPHWTRRDGDTWVAEPHSPFGGADSGCSWSEAALSRVMRPPWRDENTCEAGSPPSMLGSPECLEASADASQSLQSMPSQLLGTPAAANTPSSTSSAFPPGPPLTRLPPPTPLHRPSQLAPVIPVSGSLREAAPASALEPPSAFTFAAPMAVYDELELIDCTSSSAACVPSDAEEWNSLKESLQLKIQQTELNAQRWAGRVRAIQADECCYQGLSRAGPNGPNRWATAWQKTEETPY